MKKNIGNLLNFLLLLLGIFLSEDGVASCRQEAAYSRVVPLTASTLSAGTELPIGSVILIQKVTGAQLVTVYCTAGAITPVFELTGGNVYPGQTNIYQSGISGLGVRFKQTYDNRYYPFSGTVLIGPGLTFQENGYLSFDIEFVKMGPITSGAINTSSFPQLNIKGTDNTGAPVNAASHTFSGTVVIQEASCTTPNFSWNLGDVNMGDLQNKGDSSKWVDTPVTLTGCSPFFGNNSNGSYTKYSLSDGITTQPVDKAPNILTMTLTPNTSVIDSANGIISLDGMASASGFGVQVGSKISGNYIPQNLASGIDISPQPGETSGTVMFPLGARITRTSNDANSGKISTSLIYTISYK